MLTAFGQGQPELVTAIQARREQNWAELMWLGFADLPLLTVHSGFHHDNIRFGSGTLTALLDFDLAHVDARIVDIAISIALDCREPPSFDAVDAHAAGAFLGGYIAETPLGARERRLIIPLLRAQTLGLFSFRLTQWATGGGPRTLRSIANWLTIRFPAIEERAAAIEAAVSEAVLPHSRS